MGAGPRDDPDRTEPTPSTVRDGPATPASTALLDTTPVPLGPAPTGLEISSRYVVENEVARGGLGRVMQAWDRKLRRRVVIKELMNTRALSEDRFIREAMLTAQLEHPSIVPIHDAGRLPSGQPFYAMKQVSGETLAQVVRNKATRGERLALLPHVVAIAEAMAYAHSRKIIHRDLKPQNVLIGSFGETVVIDWGLAKRVGPDSEDHDTPPPDTPDEDPTDQSEELTRAGSVMGTPAYMPIEQALGKAVDERVDVYAIGALLYFVLAGRAPYDRANPRRTLKALEDGPPPPIATVEPETPRELVAIVDKAMARDAADRYPSAGELAADLQAYTTGRIVGAHRYSAREMLGRWLRRYRAPLAAIAVMLVVLAVVAIVSVREIIARGRRAEAARALAEEQSAAARHRAAEVLREGARSALLRGEPLEARAKLRGSLEIEDSTYARALWQALRHEPLVWKRDLGAAIYNVGFSPDGRTLAAASQDHSIYLIDVGTQETRVLRGQPDQVTSLAWAPDGQTLASGSWSGDVLIWDLRDGSNRVLSGHRAATWALAFAPDGSTLVSGSIDRTLKIWDAGTGALRRTLTGHEAEIPRVAISRDGTTLVSCSSDHTVRLWDLATGEAVRTLVGHTTAVFGCDASPDRRHIASASWDSTVKIWDAATGAVVRTLHGHHGQVMTASYSPDGTRLASAGADREILVWDVVTGAVKVRMSGDFDRVNDVDFSPDGRFLASGGNDNTLRIWDLGAAGTELLPSGHALPVIGVAFSHDGTRLATASYDRTVRIWDAATGAQLSVLTGHTQRVYVAAFTPDDTRVVTGSGDQSMRVWEVASGQELARFEQGASVYGLAISPDGTRVLTGGTDSVGRLFNLDTGAPLGELRGHTDRIYGVAWSHDGKRAATAAYDNTARVWDVDAHRTAHVLRGHTDVVDGVVFSPDGATVITGAEDKTVRVWDLARDSHRVLATQPGRVYRIALDPAGTTVASAGSDGVARLWPLAGGPAMELRGHRGEVDDVAFSPDGATVASSSDDGTVRLWSTRTGAPLWRAPMLWAPTASLLTHLGWISLRDSGGPPPEGSWRRAVEDRAERVEIGPDGALCMLTRDGRLERWSVSADRRDGSEDVLVGAGASVAAVPGGCAVLAGGIARLWTATGPQVLAEHASAIAWDRDALLVATERAVTAFDPSGRRTMSWDSALGVTALTRHGDRLVLGFANGGIELVPLDPDTARPHFAFRDVPSSPVVALAAGPLRTLIVGYANGVIGLWDLDNGASLFATRLHGPIAHLHRDRDLLDVATELGEHTRLDLAGFSARYCDVLDEVWRDVPVVWEGGLLERRDAPGDHRCALNGATTPR